MTNLGVTPKIWGVPDTQPTDLLGSTEAAAFIGVERSTITRWMDKGWIAPARRLTSSNGALLFTRSEVERAKAAHEARLMERAAG